jgi:EmrB/QacA subfamily drug resistance transporter
MNDTAQQHADAINYPATRWAAMAVLLIAGFMNLVDVTIVNVALPSMQASLGATTSGIEWIVAAYTLSFALGLLPFGRLGDTFGRRRMFLAGVVAFTFTSMLCGLAPDMPTLIAARALQGFSGAIMAPQTLAIAQVIFPPKERGAAFALFGLTASLAAVTGPLAGGLLIGADLWGLDWRPIFLVNVPVGIFAFIAGMRLIPPMPGHRSTGTDVPGIVLAGLAVFLLVFPLIEGRNFGWPAWCFAMMAAAVPAGWAFVAWQRLQADRGGPQLIPVSLLSNRNFLVGTLLSTAFFSCVPGFFMVLAIFLQTGFGLTPLQSGLTTLPFSIGIMISSIVSGRLGIRWPRERILLGSALMACAMLWLRFRIGSVDDEIGRIELLPQLLLAGLGMGTAIAPLFQTILATVGGRDAGSASGALQSFQQVGGGLGVAIMGQIFFSALAGGMAEAAGGNPHPVFVASLQSALVYEVLVLAAVAACVYLLAMPAHGAGQGQPPARPVPTE